MHFWQKLIPEMMHKVLNNLYLSYYNVGEEYYAKKKDV